MSAVVVRETGIGTSLATHVSTWLGPCVHFSSNNAHGSLQPLSVCTLLAHSSLTQCTRQSTPTQICTLFEQRSKFLFPLISTKLGQFILKLVPNTFRFGKYEAIQPYSYFSARTMRQTTSPNKLSPRFPYMLPMPVRYWVRM